MTEFNIFTIFPALLERHVKTSCKNKSWTKSGPGRRHNYLTAAQQKAADNKKLGASLSL